MARLTLAEQLQAAQQALAEQQNSNGLLTAELRNALAENGQLKASINELLPMKAEVIKLREEAEKVKKELDSAKNSYAYANQRAEKAESELEQCHAVLDGVDGAPARSYEGKYGDQQRGVVTRLAGAFLSIAKTGGVK
jgi:uncharacterized coiled-coil DUF342 family protein